MTTLLPQDQHAFLPLPENRLALAAVNRLGPKVKRRTARLVTLVAPAGYGKSHLARELIRSWESSRTERKHLLVTASQFAAEFADASAGGAIAQFQRRYRHDVELFICEDVQSLGSRRETQQQLLAAIDEIVTTRGLVLLTSTLMPGEIRGLAPRLVNRMHGGICVSVEPLGESSRQALIAHLAVGEALPLSMEEAETIAREYAVSPRELLGLLRQLRMETQRPPRGSSPHELREMLSELRFESTTQMPEIAKVTAKNFGLRLQDLKSPRRSKTITLARQIAMYLARELGKLHYAAIGEFFNRRNHSTVIHACQKIEALIDADPKVSHDVATIRKQLTDRAPG